MSNGGKYFNHPWTGGGTVPTKTCKACGKFARIAGGSQKGGRFICAPCKQLRDEEESARKK